MYENVVYIPTKNYHKITVMIQAAIKCFTDNIFTTFFTVKLLHLNLIKKKTTQHTENFKLPSTLFCCKAISLTNLNTTINILPYKYSIYHC